jgi:hypothetical protein
MSKKPDLPKLNPDDTWEVDVSEVHVKIREAKLRERSEARRKAANADEDPNLAEGAYLMELIAQRRTKDGTYETMPYTEIMNRGETFLTKLQWQYGLGLMALEEKNKNLLKPTNLETTPTQKSVNSVRP